LDTRLNLFLSHMLLSKKLLHLVFICEQHKNVKRPNFSLVIYSKCLKLKIFSVLSFYRFILVIKKQYKKTLLYYFFITTMDSTMFNSILIYIYNIIKSVKYFKTFKLGLNKNEIKKHTVLRSPFVHKKSREQFIFKKSIGYVSLKVLDSDIYFTQYIDFFIKKRLKALRSIKLFVKKIIILT